MMKEAIYQIINSHEWKLEYEQFLDINSVNFSTEETEENTMQQYAIFQVFPSLKEIQNQVLQNIRLPYDGIRLHRSSLNSASFGRRHQGLGNQGFVHSAFRDRRLWNLPKDPGKLEPADYAECLRPPWRRPRRRPVHWRGGWWGHWEHWAQTHPTDGRSVFSGTITCSLPLYRRCLAIGQGIRTEKGQKLSARRSQISCKEEN